MTLKNLFLRVLFSTLSLLAGIGLAIATQAVATRYSWGLALFMPILGLGLWQWATIAFSDRFAKNLFPGAKVGYGSSNRNDDPLWDTSGKEVGETLFLIDQMGLAFLGLFMALLAAATSGHIR